MTGKSEQSRKGLNDVTTKQITSKISRYIHTLYSAEDDIPTLAGLAVYLNTDKKTLEDWENGEDTDLKNAVIKAKNQIEHYFVSRSALKKINSSTAHFYLNNVFHYAKDTEKGETGDFSVKISVDE